MEKRKAWVSLWIMMIFSFLISGIPVYAETTPIDSPVDQLSEKIAALYEKELEQPDLKSFETEMATIKNGIQQVKTDENASLISSALSEWGSFKEVGERYIQADDRSLLEDIFKDTFNKFKDSVNKIAPVTIISLKEEVTTIYLSQLSQPNKDFFNQEISKFENDLNRLQKETYEKEDKDYSSVRDALKNFKLAGINFIDAKDKASFKSVFQTSVDQLTKELDTDHQRPLPVDDIDIIFYSICGFMLIIGLLIFKSRI